MHLCHSFKVALRRSGFPHRPAAAETESTSSIGFLPVKLPMGSFATETFRSFQSCPRSPHQERPQISMCMASKSQESSLQKTACNLDRISKAHSPAPRQQTAQSFSSTGMGTTLLCSCAEQFGIGRNLSKTRQDAIRQEKRSSIIPGARALPKWGRQPGSSTVA